MRLVTQSRNSRERFPHLLFALREIENFLTHGEQISLQESHSSHFTTDLYIIVQALTIIVHELL